MSAVPAEVVDAKTGVEEPPVTVTGTAPSAQCKPSSFCCVATLVSLATAAKGPLLVASAKKHHSLFSRSGSRETAAFGRGLHGWCFDTERFAQIYASKVEDDKRRWRNVRGETFSSTSRQEGSVRC